MPRTSLAVTTTTAGGTVLPVMVAVDQPNGNQFPNTGKELIEITNGHSVPITATFVTHGTYDVSTVSYPIADLAVSITNGTSKVCGPFDRTLFNDSATANVFINWDVGTAVTCRVISLGVA